MKLMDRAELARGTPGKVEAVGSADGDPSNDGNANVLRL